MSMPSIASFRPPIYSRGIIEACGADRCFELNELADAPSRAMTSPQPVSNVVSTSSIVGAPGRLRGSA